MVIWHPLRTNPLDHVGDLISGECGTRITLEHGIRGFTVTADKPIDRQIAECSNFTACQALNTWGARIVSLNPNTGKNE